MTGSPGRTIEEVVAHLNIQGGTMWRLLDPFVGGYQSGAWRLESNDGLPAVLKLALTRDWAEQVLRAERAVAVVRRAGYPTPKWLATGITASGTGYQVQELIAGCAAQVIDADHARSLIDVLERQAGLDPDPERCWSDVVLDDVTTNFDALCAAAAQTGPAGHRLVPACRHLIDGLDPYVELSRHDIVHGDFRPENILFDHGKVNGVVDIEAIGSGSRAFDYATLLDHPHLDADALALLVSAGAHAAGPDVLRLCLVRVALDLVGFMYRTALPISNDQRAERVQALCDRLGDVDELLSV